MKRYFYLALMIIGVTALVGCKAEEGTDEGNDGAPVVSVYQYEPDSSYNSDEDVRIRFATNGKASEFYYLAETVKDKEAFVASQGIDAYMDHVVEAGTKADASKDMDVTLTGMAGTYAITAVAVAPNGAKAARETIFYGLAWTTVAKGTYQFNVLGKMGLSPVKTELQICDTDENLYRFKDVFGSGHSLKLTALPKYTATDADGTYVFCRIKAQSTGLTHPKYGPISVRDVGYWQGNDAWITDNGYESGIYLEGEKYSAFIMAQYYVSAGNLGYNYDFFTPED